MAWQDFEFDPVEGLENTTVFESKPSSGARARQQVMTPLNQIKAFINTKVKEVSTDLGTHKADSVTDADGAHGLKIESGTFTPTIIDSLGGEATYSRQAGSYKIIGPLVYVQFTVEAASKGTITTGNIYIGGLPTAAVSDDSIDVGSANIDNIRGVTYPSGIIKIGSEVRRNTTYIVLRFLSNNGSQTYVTGSNVSDDVSFRGSLVYRRS